MPILVTMPKWGLTMKTGTVSEWLHAEGDQIEAGEPLLAVETDKAISEVEAPATGTLRKIVAAEGAAIPVTEPVALISAPGETLSDEEVASYLAALQRRRADVAEHAGQARQPREARAAARSDDGRVNASPAARKLAKELGIELAGVAATGPGGRITSDDVARAAAGEAEAREELVTLPNGLRLFYVLAGQASQTPPLVFLHGLGGSQSTWQMVLPALAAHRRVCALDLPGHGQSDKPAPATADYTLAGLADAVVQALRTLHLSPAVLVGHSLGGAVAMQIVLAHPGVAHGLVLVDSAGLGDEISPELFERIEAPPSREEARRLLELFFHDPRFVLESGIDESHEQRLQPGADEAVRAVAAASMSRQGQHTGLPARLGELQLPVLIIWGARDRVIPAAHAAAAASALPGAQVVLLEESGHVPQVESAGAVARAIEGFVGTMAG
ncbi:MAG TPA: acetoin dehydrogenase dihydrolipoyllysine-residue acetyltransferase subunit [Chloroflexota bacterium]|nr:acetoin dehydrogenase dihydrolipoyllysine-residue acetyltransferase subunit [Chloroflexota bacterium]